MSGVVDVFSNGGTPLEKFMALMTLGSTLIPMVTGLTKLLTLAKEKD
jgi:hypothetical protein